MSLSERKAQLNFFSLLLSHKSTLTTYSTTEDILVMCYYTHSESVICSKYPETFAIITGRRTGKSDSNHTATIYLKMHNL